jgi:hypothetical protein
MRVYYPGTRVNHQVFVAPAADPRTNQGAIDSEWINDDGTPKTLLVEFRDGAADVPDALGRYLIATGQAKRTRLWTPPGFRDSKAA